MNGTLEQRLRQPFWPQEASSRGALIFAVLLAAALRSIRLMDLFPVLVDEAIYMRWAEIIQHQHSWFISLLDGKPPLGYWIYAATRLALPHDPLLADRLVSVAAGVLSVIVLYRIGFLCAGPLAGAITALLYSVLPFGVFYDRIAYIDSLVNLSGAFLVYTSLSCFGRSTLQWNRSLAIGLTLGVALFIKTTILLFALAPLAIGLFLRWRTRGGLARHLCLIYAVAALFPLFSQFAIPPGPTFAVNNVLLHHTNFFTPMAVLLHDPFLNLRINAPLLAGCAASYLTYPTLAAAAAAIALFRMRLVIVILAACVLPFVIPLETLEYFPSRYAFPHAWPLLLAIGCAAGGGASFSLHPGFSRPPILYFRVAAYTVAAIAFAAMAYRSVRIVVAPQLALHERDVDEFLSSSPYSGYGVLDAIALLRTEAKSGPITILTDPWWGPPTDAVFAYLNQVDGTNVYEAWWLQLDGEYPLVPSGPMPVWKSQYERVTAGDIDFSTLPRLYYITDTNYHTAPAAHLIHRFPKPGGTAYIDVYRLN